MVIYTPIPIEFLGFEEEEVKSNVSEMQYGSVKLEVKFIEGNNCMINRIISTNPNDFLREDIKPGAVLKLKPE